MNATTTPDLLAPSDTPRTNAVKEDFGATIDLCMDLERELAAMRAAAIDMARALQRGPFENEVNFALRREMAFARFQETRKD